MTDEGRVRGRVARSLLGMVLVAWLVTACSGGGGEGDEPSSAAPQPGGDLIIARTSDSTTLDATAATLNEDIWILQQIYQTLYSPSPDGQDLVPTLATGHELAEDGLTWTFDIRQGVTFSDGGPMTAEDVAFSLNEARTSGTGYTYLDAAIKKVTAVDDATVEIVTKYPWAPLVADLALFANGIVPADYGGLSKKAFYESPVGTGPFMLDHWTEGDELVLAKNPNYWEEGLPYLDSVTWKNVPDSNARVLQLKGDQVQIVEFPAWSQMQSLGETPGIEATTFPSTASQYILLNNGIEPLDDVHVRRAIAAAIDRDAIIQTVLFGNGEPANSFIHPSVPYYDPASPGLQYDLALAQEEMAKSSVPDGFELEFMVPSGETDFLTVAQIVQEELGAIGIDVSILKLDANAANDALTSLDYEMTFQGWTMDIMDPDELVSFAVDPTTGGHSFFTDYHNDEVIDLTHQAQREFDDTVRGDLYAQIQTIAANDAFMVYVYYSPFAYAYADSVKGFEVYPTGWYPLTRTWMS